MVVTNERAQELELQCEDGSGNDSDEYTMTEYDGPEDEHHEVPIRMMLLVMLCMFQGYAAMVGPLQARFKQELGIVQGSAASHVFTQAAVCVHWGKLLARFGHIFLCGCFTSSQRVYLSMVLMLIGALIPPLLVFAVGWHWVGTVFIAYGLSGIGLGIFECTFLNAITPLGRLTKAWAIMGAPAGFGMICVIGLICTSIKMPVEILYWYIVACIPIGMAVFYFYGPQEPHSGKLQLPSSDNKQASFMSSMKNCGSWLPRIVPHIIAKFGVCFVMENVAPVLLYTYNANQVPMLSPQATDHLMPHDSFFALLYVFIIAGDAISRRVPYCMNLDTYCSNVVKLLIAGACSITGFLMERYAIALVSLPATFLAFWGNGLVYGVSAKYIDRFVPKEHNLAAYSMWCFVGDAGGIAGATLVDLVLAWVCGGVSYPFECKGSVHSAVLNSTLAA